MLKNTFLFVCVTSVGTHTSTTSLGVERERAGARTPARTRARQERDKVLCHSWVGKPHEQSPHARPGLASAAAAAWPMIAALCACYGLTVHLSDPLIVQYGARAQYVAVESPHAQATRQALLFPTANTLALEGSAPRRIPERYKDLLENDVDIDMREYFTVENPLEAAARTAQRSVDSAAPVAKQALDTLSKQAPVAKQALDTLSKQALDAAAPAARQALDAAAPMARQALDAAEKGVRQGVEAAVPVVQQGVEAAKPMAKQAFNAAAPVAKQAFEAATPVAKQALDAAAPVVKQGVDAAVDAAVEAGALPALTRGVAAAAPLVTKAVTTAAPPLTKGALSATCYVTQAGEVRPLEERVAELERQLRHCDELRTAEAERASAAVRRADALEGLLKIEQRTSTRVALQ